MDDSNTRARAPAEGEWPAKTLMAKRLRMDRTSTERESVDPCGPTPPAGAADTRQREAEKLSAFSLFDGVDPERLEQLRLAARLHVLDKGQVQFLPDDCSEAVFFLVAGRIKVSRLSASGKELVLDIVEPGEVYGATAVLDGAPHEAMAEAVETSRCWMVPSASFRALVRRAPDLLMNFTLRLARRQRLLERRLIDAAHASASERLNRLLLKLGRTYGCRGRRGIWLRIKLSQATIGNMLGVSREIVNHEFARLRERGAIDVIDGRILILHPETLAGSPRASTTRCSNEEERGPTRVRTQELRVLSPKHPYHASV